VLGPVGYRGPTALTFGVGIFTHSKTRSMEIRIEELEKAVAGIADELAFALHHLERLATEFDSEEVRLSDRHRIAQAAEQLVRVSESLRT